MNLTTVISSEIDKLKRRLVKVLRGGKSDVQRVKESMPSGWDSAPIKGMVAVYSENTQKAHPVILGYFNVNQISEPGEARIYSLSSQGEVKAFIMLRTDGSQEFNGTGNYLSKFNELKAGFDQLRTEFNTHIHTGNLGAPTTPPAVPSTASIDTSKALKLKTE